MRQVTLGQAPDLAEPAEQHLTYGLVLLVQPVILETLERLVVLERVQLLATQAEALLPTGLVKPELPVMLELLVLPGQLEPELAQVEVVVSLLPTGQANLVRLATLVELQPAHQS